MTPAQEFPEFFQVHILGKDRSLGKQLLLLNDDGTLRTWGIQIARDSTGRERIVLVESDGTLRSQTILWDGTLPVRARAETPGEARVSILGKDAAAVLASPRINTADVNQVRTEIVPWWTQIDPVVIPLAEGILWNPGADATQLYEVEFLVVNNTAVPATVTVGQDIAAGGALAQPEFWVGGETVAANSTSGWRGPFLLPGDDDVRGAASVATTLQIHWRIRRIK